MIAIICFSIVAVGQLALLYFKSSAKREEDKLIESWKQGLKHQFMLTQEELQEILEELRC